MLQYKTTNIASLWGTWLWLWCLHRNDALQKHPYNAHLIVIILTIWFYFYQILIVFSKLTFLSEVVHDNAKRLTLFTGFIKSNLQTRQQLWMFQPNDSWLWTVTDGSSQISYQWKMILLFVESYKGFLSLYVIFSRYFGVWFQVEHLFSRLWKFNRCSMSPTLDVFRCLLVTNLAALSWTISSWSNLPLL